MSETGIFSMHAQRRKDIILGPFQTRQLSSFGNLLHLHSGNFPSPLVQELEKQSTKSIFAIQQFAFLLVWYACSSTVFLSGATHCKEGSPPSPRKELRNRSGCNMPPMIANRRGFQKLQPSCANPPLHPLERVKARIYASLSLHFSYQESDMIKGYHIYVLALI